MRFCVERYECECVGLCFVGVEYDVVVGGGVCDVVDFCVWFDDCCDGEVELLYVEYDWVYYCIGDVGCGLCYCEGNFYGEIV